MRVRKNTGDTLLNVSGLPIQILILRKELEKVHKPLVAELITEAAKAPTRRFIVFIAGPAGAGKSTLAALWEIIASDINPLNVPVQVLPMDGFLRPNTYLNIHTTQRDGKVITLRQIKGAPETFDLDALEEAMKRLQSGEEMKWPIYDRKIIHDPIPDFIKVNKSGLVMVEGNYLLLDEPGWRDLHLFARCRIFIDTSEERIEKDVIQRYIIGGQKSPSQASKHYFQSDRINNIRIRDHQLSADIRLNASWVFWGNAPKR